MIHNQLQWMRDLTVLWTLVNMLVSIIYFVGSNTCKFSTIQVHITDCGNCDNLLRMFKGCINC